MTTDPSPKLPLWVFVVSDVALLVTAWLIAEYSRHPLSPAAVTAIAGCAALGTLVLLVPLLLRYERQKNEVLDERQRSLEGIARTVQESAEQLSIAANGINQIAALARQSLQTAEALPEKLKTQIDAFETKATETADAERARLEKELAAARKANADQLAFVATQIALATTEWTKLEAATRLQLGSANDALGKLDQQAAAKVTAAHAQALAALDSQLKSLAERIAAAATVVTTVNVAATPAAPTAPTETTPPAPVAAPTAAEASNSSTSAAPSEPATVVAPIESTDVAPPSAPKRIRKPRRETPAVAAAPEPGAAESAASATPISAEPALETEPAKTPVHTPETAPEATPAAAPVASVAEAGTSVPAAAVDSSATTTVTSGPGSAEPPPATAVASEAPVATPEAAPAPVPAESPRRRATRAKPEPEPEPMLDLMIDDSAPPARSIERGLSSDGATRMIVTAYIGIGNRLFIRGEGPGLSPDKGVPLQFISIGKWRWETNDATSPIRFRILKNDSVECAALGEQTLDPGYQAEFGANF